MKNIKPLILDTTFILPLFGIKIKIDDDFESDIKRVWKNEIDGYQMILPTLLNLPIKIFNCELNPKASMIASVIRHYGHPDFMDCWIAATAAVLNGIFLSEDVELKKILNDS